MDVSSYLSIMKAYEKVRENMKAAGASEEEINKIGFKDKDGKVLDEQGFFDFLAKSGVNYIRIRVWNNPYDANGKSYGGGNNDLDTAIEMGKYVTKAGMKVLIDFHLSDFWADPGKQTVPKAWKDYGMERLEQAVYDYTRITLNELMENDLLPEMIQVGNELSNGLLWPTGRVPEYDNIARYVKSGIRAVRDVSRISGKDIKVMVHLDNGGNNALYREWFDNFTGRGGEFDIIGLSYYPFWHGTMDMLIDNMKDIALRYEKDLIIAEVSMGFTMEDYASYEKLSKEERKGMATRQGLVDKIEFPMTVEGQKDFMKKLLERLEEIPKGRGKGFFYWEPAWIPVPGSGWATESALKYIEDKGPCGNEWANQALFDYQGNALPALEVVKDYKHD